jgi:cytoskeleton protein RodZ
MTVDCETMDNQTIDEPAMTLGQRLVAARVAQGLTQANIAKEMRLSLQTVIDIEADDYSHGSAIIYLRGYLRSYARLVGLNPDEVLADFEKTPWVQAMRGKENENHTAVRVTPFRAYRRTNKRHLLRWSILGLFIIIVVLVAVWWNNQQKQPHSTVKDNPTLVLPEQNLPGKVPANKLVDTPINVPINTNSPTTSKD